MLIIINSLKLSLFWLVGVLCIFACAGYSSTKYCTKSDKQALLKLKDGFIDEWGILSTWKSEVDCCQWRGISCNNLTGHVIKLNLQVHDYTKHLRGNIHSSLCDLQHLIHLDLSYNYFEGSEIPKCIGLIGQLKELRLSDAFIGGTIPQGLQNLSNLQTLDLRYNYGLIVNDLEWISNLSSLRYVDLSAAYLSQTVDWQSLLPEKAPSLVELHLDECALTSQVNPKSYFHINSSTSLKFLSLALNNLDSSILPWVSNISKVLVHLDLSGNTLQHILPNSLNINSLRVLELQENHLHLSPGAFSNMNSLESLDLSYALLHIAPKAFANVISLKSLYLTEASLQHIASYAFMNTTSLELLDLRYNELHGIMVKSISHLCRLKELWLRSNNLSGQLSEWIPQLRCVQYSIETLDLSANPFSSGPFPDFSEFSSLVTLNLMDNGLHGSIPQSFGHLPCLSYLDLSKNNLSGPIPKFVGLSSLKTLHLSNNSFNGPLPKFDRLSSLETVDLSHNNLSGPLPLFARLLSLRSLDLSNNQLNEILPGTFQKLPHLVELGLSSNKLNQAINETHLSSLTSLKVLDVSHNSISFNFTSNWVPPFQLHQLWATSGNFSLGFPVWLKYQRELRSLDISNCAISYSIPKWFWESSYRDYLNISHNKIYGKMPKSLSKMKASGFDFYYVWDLTFNNFSGPLPHFPPKAGVLLLSNNRLSGSISSLCATLQTGLSYLDMSNNLLSQRLPDCWGQFPALRVLNLANNNFSRTIPNSIGTLSLIESIHFNNNNFFGKMPSLINSPNLRFIDFGQNNLNGKLPSWATESYLPNLIGLRLQANKFQGSIPTNLCRLPFLQILDLSHNNITGTIPHCLRNLSALSNLTFSRQSITYNPLFAFQVTTDLTAYPSFMDTAMLAWKGEYVEYGENLGLMTTIDLSCNHLTGEIPSSITSLLALASLNLSRNNLSGFIPDNMGQMKMLESLDLSSNFLSGEIPISFSALSFLSFLNLSFNNLSGRIPLATQLQTFNASSYEGNQGLCGVPLSKGCPEDRSSSPTPDLLTKSSHSIDAEENDKFISFGFYVSLGLGFIIGFWGVCGTLILKSSWRHSLFQFFQNMNDWIYIQLVVFKAKIKRRFQD